MKIVDTDAFLDMPSSSQLLYFHLVMRTDDDGFVASPKKIMRILGSQEDDYKVLIAKKFIIPFESGICVIKHWRIHNFIRKDRYTETQWLNMKATLFIREDGAYTKNKNSEQIITEIRKIERPKWQEKRNKEYKNSSLPDSFSYKIRQAFWGKKCPICKCIMEEVSMSKDCKPTIQHNKPISKGGKHELENISVICSNCNVSIGDRKETGKLNNREVIKVWNTIGNQSLAQVKLNQVKLSKVNTSLSDKSDEEDIRLSNLLYEKILLNNSSYRKPNIESWAKQISLMRRIDKRTIIQIEYLINWCQKDLFWQSNILSTKKLRDKFDQLVMKIKSNQNNNAGIPVI